MTYPSLLYRLAPPINEPGFPGSPYTVRLSDDARKCVVYLGWPTAGTDDELTPEGTGFLIHTGEPGGGYLITAAHVACKLEGCPFGIRFNQKGGHGRIDRINSAEWFYHPQDNTVDVAIMPYSPPGWADFEWFPRSSFLSEQKLESKDIGAGDLAYVVGIFHFLKGTKRNMPMVHTGHVGLMAEDEPIPTEDWRAPEAENAPRININGYLVQVHTLPGTSGAPVFVRRSLRTAMGCDPSADQEHADAIKSWVYGTVWLLGLWHGAWKGKPSEDFALPKGGIVVPVGTGIVIPATKIIETMDQDMLKKQREKAQQEIDATLAVTPQSTGKKRDRILDQMLKTPPQPHKRNK